jgi:hypothetical protein
MLRSNGAKINRVGDQVTYRPRDFRHHDVVRAFRAASAAGVKDPHVKIHLSNGTVLHVGGGGEVPLKKSAQKGAALAEGGSAHMAGKGDRTKTAPEDSAGEQHPGSTAHKTSSRGSVLAEGGKQHMLKRQAADPAQPGKTGKGQSAATSASIGGIARPARPGECGT